MKYINTFIFSLDNNYQHELESMEDRSLEEQPNSHELESMEDRSLEEQPNNSEATSRTDVNTIEISETRRDHVDIYERLTVDVGRSHGHSAIGTNRVTPPGSLRNQSRRINASNNREEVNAVSRNQLGRTDVINNHPRSNRMDSSNNRHSTISNDQVITYNSNGTKNTTEARRQSIHDRTLRIQEMRQSSNNNQTGRNGMIESRTRQRPIPRNEVISEGNTRGIDAANRQSTHTGIVRHTSRRRATTPDQDDTNPDRHPSANSSRTGRHIADGNQAVHTSTNRTRTTISDGSQSRQNIVENTRTRSDRIGRNQSFRPLGTYFDTRPLRNRASPDTMTTQISRRTSHRSGGSHEAYRNMYGQRSGEVHQIRTNADRRSRNRRTVYGIDTDSEDEERFHLNHQGLIILDSEDEFNLKPEVKYAEHYLESKFTDPSLNCSICLSNCCVIPPKTETTKVNEAANLRESRTHNALETCAVNDRDTVLTKCGHTFHFNCLKIWLNAKTTCPYCRKQIRGDKCVAIFESYKYNSEC